jgi:hypothetical protein
MECQGVVLSIQDSRGLKFAKFQLPDEILVWCVTLHSATPPLTSCSSDSSDDMLFLCRL